MNARCSTFSLRNLVVAVGGAVALGVVAAPAMADDGIEIIGHGRPELTYATAVHDELVRTMRFPTGREASLTQPEGTVSVWFVLARDGKVIARGLEDSSNSVLLDNEAQQLVGRARYDALPDTAWEGEATHRFVATYRFVHQPAGASDTDSRVTLR